MDILGMGKKLLGDKMGGSGGIMEALTSLTSGQGLDMGAIADKLKSGGLGDKVDSWMGDGENASVSADEMKSALGDDQINEVATKMGCDSDKAAKTLSDSMPGLMDKMTSGGSFKEGMASGVNPIEMAKSLFK